MSNVGLLLAIYILPVLFTAHFAKIHTDDEYIEVWSLKFSKYPVSAVVEELIRIFIVVALWSFAFKIAEAI